MLDEMPSTISSIVESLASSLRAKEKLGPGKAREGLVGESSQKQEGGLPRLLHRLLT